MNYLLSSWEVKIFEITPTINALTNNYKVVQTNALRILSWGDFAQGDFVLIPSYTADVNIKATQQLFLAFYLNLSITVNLKIDYWLENIAVHCWLSCTMYTLINVIPKNICEEQTDL